jgi:hypothetical protein
MYMYQLQCYSWLIVYLFLFFNVFRYINQPNDLVSLLMVHILAQMGVELLSKAYLIYGGESSILYFKQTQVVVGWKSIYLFISLIINCVLTFFGTISDFPDTYTHVAQIQMAAWRTCLALFCLILSNDNTYVAQLYYENFFMQNNQGQPRIYLTSFIDQSHSDASKSKMIVIEKSSQEDILNRVEELMPTFVLFSKIMKMKSVFNVLNSAIFFVLSLGVIGHSEHNGMFYYNIFMIVLMSTISYTSFETISQFNNILDRLDQALTDVSLHLHVRVSSYAVDDRFLTITTGAAFLQVVLKIFGIS